MAWHWWFRGLTGFNGGDVATMLVAILILVEFHSFILHSSISTTFHHPHQHQDHLWLPADDDATCCWLRWSCLLPRKESLPQHKPMRECFYCTSGVRIEKSGEKMDISK